MDAKNLKSFFRPDAKKVILVFVLEFFLTFMLLLTGESGGAWVYALSPNVLYLESTIDLLTSTTLQIAFHGAVANVIALTYLYFISCLIVTLYRRLRR